MTDTEEALLWLARLLDYKSVGKGVKPWFDGRYFDRDGVAHPRFNPCGAGTGRLSSANPNFQNIPSGKVASSLMKQVRRAIIARPNYELWVADYGQLELRVVLWYAYRLLGQSFPALADDLFSLWLPLFGDSLNHASDLTKRAPREILKSGVYGGLYLEGLKVFSRTDLSSKVRKKDRDEGALVVFEDWKVFGRPVCFSGINLAKRLKGEATREARREALGIQELIWSRIPEVREWHRSLVPWVEKGYVRSHSGRVLPLHGSLEDRYKVAAAAIGQGGGADVVQDAMVRYWELGEQPLIQVHDELVFEKPAGASDAEVHAFFDPMRAESRVFEGLRVPAGAERGMNWLDTEKVYV